MKIYKELGFEPLKFRRWFRRLCVFYKLRSTQTPKCLYNFIPSGNGIFNTRHQDKVETYYCRKDLLNTIFKYIPYTIFEWNKLDITLRNAKSYLIFRNSLLKIGNPIQNLMFKIHDPLGTKFLTRLRLGLSHLNEHRFRHNFQDCSNPLCSCSLEVKSTAHFFLHCHHFNQLRQTLLDTVKKISNGISIPTDDGLVKILLCGSQTYNFEEYSKISKIIKASIKCILSTERFSDPLL